MVIKILDKKTRNIVGTFSDFISLIWTERFNSYGDFELETPLTKKHFSLLTIDNYIEIPTSSNLMFIENITIQDDDENSKITVKGKSFESVLGRRIVYYWRDTQKDTTLYNILNLILKDNLLNENVAGRKINLLTIDLDMPEDVKELKMQTSINRGDNLGDAVYSLGKLYGFYPQISFDPSTKNVVMSLYFGKNTNISFKHANYNLSKTSYAEYTDNFKTSAIVAGDGDGSNRNIVVVSRSTKKAEVDENNELIEVAIFDYNDVERREIFVDARDIQKESGESKDNYKNRLKERGVDRLKENNKEYIVDGTITNTGKYVLNVDYRLGDIVKIETGFYSATARITEIIQSWSETGYEIYPSFETIEVTSGDISESYNIT